MTHLLVRAKAGDATAEGELFEHLLVRFRALAKRRVDDGQDAEDVAQEACLTVLEKYKAENYTTAFEAWAYGVLRMKIGNYMQSEKARRRRVAAGFSVDDAVEISAPPGNPALRQKLIDCLKMIFGVHPRYARVLNLVYQGYKTVEICRRLKVEPNNMYVILNRGRAMLKQCLQTGQV